MHEESHSPLACTHYLKETVRRRNPTLDKAMGGGCSSCTFRSDFGTGLGTYPQVYGYIASRAATFFQAIITGISGSLHESKWVDIENKRFAGNTADDPVINHSLDCDNQ